MKVSILTTVSGRGSVSRTDEVGSGRELNAVFVAFLDPNNFPIRRWSDN